MRPELLLALALSLGCVRRPPAAAELPDLPPSTAVELPIQDLMGTWYVVETTLPFWRDRTDPRLTYRPLAPRRGLERWEDVVTYRKEGRPRRIVGVDTLDPTRAGHFEWRGSGLLAALRSQCFVVLWDPDGAWAVTYFSPTRATPAGMDVLSRHPTLGSETLVQIHRRIAADPFLSAQWVAPFAPAHTEVDPARSAP